MLYKILFFRGLGCCLCFVFGLVVLSTEAISQTRIVSGTVKSDDSELLPRASITLTKTSGDIIVYTISTDQGRYTLEIPESNSSDQVFLEVNYLGFRPQRIELIADKDEYDFTLESDATALEEIVIKNRPVVKRTGDTLKYRVLSFQKSEDRSIGDVLKRMPGVQVDEDGAIYFNGQKVSNLYIQGDDLMDGRYGLATKAIRKEDIEGVDVIKNHQPIKVLQGKVLSEKVAMNLVLKDENSMAVSTKVDAAGGAPGVYDFSVTPILLNKRIKMLNTAAINNAGVDYRTDFKQLGDSDLRSDLSKDPASFSLSLGTVGVPNLPVENYYFNRSKVLNLNNLYTTNGGLQVKINVQAFTDFNSLTYASRVTNFTATDTINYSEDQQINQKPSLVNSTLNLLKNGLSSFFQNKLSFTSSQINSDAFIASNQQSFSQELKRNSWSFSNDFNWIPQLKNEGVFEVRWLTQYDRDKRNLNIGDGYDSEIPNFKGFNEQVNQSLRLPRFYSNAYVSYIKGAKKLKQNYQLGYVLEQMRLESSLSFKNDGEYQEFQGDPGNNLEWRKQQVYFKPLYQFTHRKFDASVAIPFTFQSIVYEDVGYNLDKEKRDIIINPEINLKYEVASEQDLIMSYAYNYDFGDITQVYRGAILRNYRFLEANEANLQERKKHSLDLNYKFEKSVDLLFINTGLHYNSTQTNFLLSYKIEDDIQTIVSLPIENDIYTYGANFGFSKYVFALRNTLSFKTQWNSSQFNGLINDRLVPFKNDAFTFSTKFDKRLFKSLDLNYTPRLIINKTKVGQGFNGDYSYQTLRFDQLLNLGLKPVKSLLTEFEIKHNYVDQDKQDKLHYLFCDLNFKYALKNKDLDVGFSISNLFNVKEYNLYSLSESQLFSSSYRLRGTMALIRVEWFF